MQFHPVSTKLSFYKVFHTCANFRADQIICQGQHSYKNINQHWKCSIKLIEERGVALQKQGGICGPWIPDDGKIVTHTVSKAGKMSQKYWTSKVSIHGCFGDRAWIIFEDPIRRQYDDLVVQFCKRPLGILASSHIPNVCRLGSLKAQFSLGLNMTVNCCLSIWHQQLSVNQSRSSLPTFSPESTAIGCSSPVTRVWTSAVENGWTLKQILFLNMTQEKSNKKQFFEI